MPDKSRTIILPARMQSQRFPGKLLHQVGGKTILEHTLDKAERSLLADKIIVATDEPLVANRVSERGIEVVFTEAEHRCGTDRCAEVVQLNKIHGLVINLQADEMFIRPTDIDRIFKALDEFSDADVISMMGRLDIEDLSNTNIVKVVCNESGYAMDFLRSVDVTNEQLYHHIGIYGFHAAGLVSLAALPVTKLERDLSLEQMRWLGHGRQIKMIETDHTGFSINVPKDLERAQVFFKNKGT